MPFHIGTPSAPSSRASSPTRRNSRNSISGNIAVPARSTPILDTATATTQSTDPRSDYFGSQPTTPGASSGFSTPHYGSYTGSGDAFGGTGAMTPGGSYYHHQPVEIVLDSEQLVMRGTGGDMNPAYLSGRVELQLAESTNIKEINMSLHGKAKIQFSDGTGTGSKNHHHTHQCLTHDWSFLQGDKRHTHTLKAGHHSFPFSLMLHGNLPCSIHTFSGDAIISYKLHATVVRSGFASNFHDVKRFTLQKMYTSDALEFNQTLEIENTWPGKIMYALTLPFKAYAAGDEIPVSVKFMPLAKGVRVTSVTSVIKEYTQVHTRHSTHTDQRVASSVKHELRNGQAYLVTEEMVRPPLHWVDPSGSSSRIGSGLAARTPLVSASASTGRQNSYFGNASGHNSNDAITTSPNAEAGPSSNAGASSEGGEEDVEIGDDEVNTHFTIPIPRWTTPSHSVHPAFVTHKIKWSCSISNMDGHVSELRCALPIIILDHSVLEEARSSGANTRALLFGGGAADEAQAVDLPSYSNHVYDRVAVADSGSAAGYAPRGGQSGTTSASVTPPISRGPSRPGSPTGHHSSEGGGGDDDLPPRRELSSWADSELLMSLGSLRVHSPVSSPNSTPATSRGPSRPLSRRSSRSGPASRGGSRANSRANSPDRSGYRSPPNEEQNPRPSSERRHTGGLGSLLHLPASFKHRPHHSKPILRNSSHAGLTHLHQGEGIQRNTLSFTNLQDRGHHATGERGRVSFANDPSRDQRARFHVGGPSSPGEGEHGGEEDDNMDPINQVPSYDIASRGFLGGGITPIDIGLPTYDASERNSSTDLPSRRSDTALVEMGSQAAAEAEARAT